MKCVRFETERSPESHESLPTLENERLRTHGICPTKLEKSPVFIKALTTVTVSPKIKDAHPTIETTPPTIVECCFENEEKSPTGRIEYTTVAVDEKADIETPPPITDRDFTIDNESPVNGAKPESVLANE